MLFGIFNRLFIHPVFLGAFVRLDDWFFRVFTPITLPSPLSAHPHFGSSLKQVPHGRSACGLYGHF
jgi:hypothetical protein